jgi:hypothetical protein
MQYCMIHVALQAVKIIPFLLTRVCNLIVDVRASAENIYEVC